MTKGAPSIKAKAKTSKSIVDSKLIPFRVCICEYKKIKIILDALQNCVVLKDVESNETLARYEMSTINYNTHIGTTKKHIPKNSTVKTIISACKMENSKTGKYKKLKAAEVKGTLSPETYDMLMYYKKYYGFKLVDSGWEYIYIYDNGANYCISVQMS